MAMLGMNAAQDEWSPGPRIGRRRPPIEQIEPPRFGMLGRASPLHAWGDKEGPAVMADTMAASELPVQAPQMAPTFRKPGMLGMLGRAWNNPNGAFGVSPDRWAQLAAGFHDLSRGTNTMPEVMQQQRENAWQSEQQARQREAWDNDRKRMEAAQNYVNGLTDPTQRAIGMADPTVAIRAGAEQAFARPQEGFEGGFKIRRNADGTAEILGEVPLNAEQRASIEAQRAAAARAGEGRGEMQDARMFSQGQGLADDFRQQVKGYQDIADTGALAAQYSQRLRAGQRDPAMEGALLMKIAGGLQSGVLSDNDIRTASGGTLPTNVLSLVDTATGRGRISQAQIEGLLNVARLQDQRARQRVQGYVDNVRGIARARGIPENYIFGVDPIQTMFPQQQAAPEDNTAALVQRLHDLEASRRTASSSRGLGATYGNQPGGYRGR